jgi:peptidoglycan/xylan/chitin deacetylase (PgdA/CDA1 family)
MLFPLEFSVSSSEIMQNAPNARRSREDLDFGQTEALARENASFDWRKAIAGSLHYSGLLKVMRRISKTHELQRSGGSSWPRLRKASSPKFVILCYHRVGTGGVPLYSELPAEIFAEQMRHVSENYRVLSLEGICRALENPTSAESGVAVTFDDGYHGVYEEAFPALKKYQIPATVFLTVDAIETGQIAWYDRVFLALNVTPKDQLDLELDRVRHVTLSSPRQRLEAAIEIMSYMRKLPDWRRKECCAVLEKQVELPKEKLANRMMNWQHVQTMQRAGITFGSHTLSHPVVSQLPPDEMERELLESKKILEEKLDCPVLDFAFPFGQLHDCGLEMTAPVVARCGYRSASTTVPGINTLSASPFGLLRAQIGEERDLAMFAFRLNQLFLFADSLHPRVPNRQELSSLLSTCRDQDAIVRGARDA